MTTERELQTAIVKGSNKEGFHLFKIIDAPNSGKKPFDISGIALNGIGIAMEVKKIEKPQRYIPWSLFSAHQINWLRVYAEANAYSIVAIYYEATSQLEFIRVVSTRFNSSHIDRFDTHIPRITTSKTADG